MDVTRLLQFVNVVMIITAHLCGAVNLEDDLRRLAEMLPGTYSNNAQQTRGPDVRRPFGSHEDPVAALTAMPLKAVYRPVEVSFLPDSFNLYVEQTLKRTSKPHKRWLYSFSTDETTRSLKLRTYNFNDDSVVEKISKNPQTIKYLSENDVTTQSSCDTMWRRLGDMYIGTTSRQCQAVLDGEQVRRYVNW